MGHMKGCSKLRHVLLLVIVIQLISCTTSSEIVGSNPTPEVFPSPENELKLHGINFPILLDNPALYFASNPAGKYRITDSDLAVSTNCTDNETWTFYTAVTLKNNEGFDKDQYYYQLYYSVHAALKPNKSIIGPVKATLLLNPQLEYIVMPPLTWLNTEYPFMKNGFRHWIEITVSDNNFPVQLDEERLRNKLDIFFRENYVIIEYGDQKDVIKLDKHKIIFTNTAMDQE